MWTVRVMMTVGLAFAGGSGCGGGRLLRRGRVARELRVTAPSRPAVDRWFGAVHALQDELAMAESRRLHTQLLMHRALLVSPTAPLDVVSVALQRALTDAGHARVPFRVRPTAEERAARERWQAFLRSGAVSDRRAAFAILESALGVTFLLDDATRRALAPVLDPVEQHLRRVATLDVTMAHCIEVAASLQAERAALAEQAGADFAGEFVAAADFLDSVRPRATLQVQESRSTELWLRGVLVPEGDELDDEGFLHELDQLRQ